MNEAVFRLNSISVYGFGLLAVVSFLWGSFVFYQKSIESRLDEKLILDSVVLAAFWGFIVGRIVYAFLDIGTFLSHWSRLFLLSNYPGLNRWGVLIGFCVGIWLSIRKIKAKLLDWLDLVALGVSAGSSVFFAGLSIMVFMWQFVLISVLYFLAFIYFWRVENRYRTLDWYRNDRTSARSGFIFGFSICFWGLLYGLEKILLSSFSWVDGVWAGALFVGGVVLVYIRSGRTLRDDINIIFKHGKK